MYSIYTKEQVKKFVSQFGDIIISAITNKNLFFSAVVGQLTVESKFGTSGLSSQHNNYGGIKATGSQFSNGQVSLDTTEVISGRERPVADSFATYPDFQSFMNDYTRVLALPSYIGAGVYTATTPYDQVLAIGKGGYSTRDPKAYLTMARGRIDACLDLFPLGKISAVAVDPGAILSNSLFTGVGYIMQSINSVFGNSGAAPAKTSL